MKLQSFPLPIMVNFTILAGAYSSFIATYLFNTDTSSLTLLSQSQTGLNPTWIGLHPTNHTILYAVNEIAQGELQSFILNPNGSLTGPIDQVSSGGNGPVFTGFLPSGQIAVPNYGDGSGIVIPLTQDDPLSFVKNATPVTFPPPAATVSHPHMSLPYKNEVFFADLVSIQLFLFLLVQIFNLTCLGWGQNMEVGSSWF